MNRGPYGNVKDADIDRFKDILPGSGRVITDSSELLGYNTDWLKTCRGEKDLSVSAIYLSASICNIWSLQICLEIIILKNKYKENIVGHLKLQKGDERHNTFTLIDSLNTQLHQIT